MKFEKLLSQSASEPYTYNAANGKRVRIETLNYAVEGIIDMPVLYEIDDSNPDNIQVKQQQYSDVHLTDAVLYTHINSRKYKHVSVKDDRIQRVQLLSV